MRILSLPKGFKKFSPKTKDYQIGDITPLGKIEDIYKNQYKINNQWYAKKIVQDMLDKKR